MIRKTWQSIFLPFLFWILAFAILKFTFVVIHWDQLQELELSHIFGVFTNSIGLDVAAATYIMAIPIISYIIHLVLRQNRFQLWIKWYYTAVIAFVAILNVVDMELFKHWQTKLNVKAISFLNEPELVAGSAGVQQSIFLLLLMALLTLILFRLFNCCFFKEHHTKKRSWLKTTLLSLSLIALFMIGIRGGLQEIPVNQSDAYYSHNPTLNYAGVNSVWNIGNSFFQNRKFIGKNRYKVMKEEDAAAITKKLYTTASDTTTQLWSTTSPNIVFVALEGVNANVIKEFKGGYNHTPNFSKLIEEGFLFTEMYASGQRTDQGLVSILSGFPALPLNTIGAQPEKFAQLPSMANALNKLGYSNSFFFGGEPEFGSFKSYLVHNNFEPIIDITSFPSKLRTQKLGVPDEHLFQRFVQDMKSAKEPFFTMLLTQTTHEPFDMPFNEFVKNDKQKYLNTVAYTDSLLGNWWKEMQKMTWFENTIFIISSDHAHPYPDNYWYTDKNRYSIPFLMLGAPLLEEFKGKQLDKICSQTDIPATILAQLEQPIEEYKWSKNTMNPYSPEFAFFIYIEGFTYLTPQFSCGREYRYKKNEFLNMESNIDSANCINTGRAHMQQLFEEYMNY